MDIGYTPFRGSKEPIVDGEQICKIILHEKILELHQKYEYIDYEETERSVAHAEIMNKSSLSICKTRWDWEEGDSYYIIELYDQGRFVSIHTTLEDVEKIYKAIKLWKQK